MATTSRVTPTGWSQGDDSAGFAHVTPTGWEQQTATAATVRGLVVKNGGPALLTTGEEGDYPALRVSGGYPVAGATGRKLTITNGQLTCNDSAST